MPVEINKSAFAAVDALFGSEEEPSEVKQHQKPVIESSQRLGVGAKAAPRHVDPISTKILQVGRKRQRENDSHVEETTFDSIVDDENDEDDLGRTAIESTAKVAVISPAENTETTTNKRKKGKKERALNKDLATGKDGNQKESAHKDTHAASENDSNKTTDADQEGKASTSSTKRKRRKIRSKQKNIYKDQREKKPDHLIVGNKNYQGRPLTAETRAKLNLAAPKTTLNPSFSGTWTGDGTNVSKKEEYVAVEKAPRPAKDSSTKGSPKKPKFKNLK